MKSLPSRAAFSILEILVVVSIIVILIAILLPALGPAHNNPKKAICLSNLRAVAEAMAVYQRNNKGCFPGSFGPAAGAPTDWDLFGSTGSGTQPGAATPWANRPLNPYLSDAVSVAHCLVDWGSDFTTTSSAWEELGSSYWYPNRADSSVEAAPPKIISGIWAIEGHRLTEVRQPAQKLVTADLVIHKARLLSDTRNQWHSTSDPMQVSAAFADSHAEYVNRKLGAEAVDVPAATNADIHNLLSSPRGYY